MSYPIAPLATGTNVFGVFEGRTPCDIASDQNVSIDPRCVKLKWRLTLYRTGEQRTYKIEGGLYRQGAREGTWSTASENGATLYRLAPSGGAPELKLRKGDDNVLFLVNEKRAPYVGNAHFSYTLNRRTE
jgi:hypothetical protein